MSPRPTFVLGLCCALLPGLAFAQAAPLMEKAERAVRDLEYSDALKHLEAARKQVGNDRATTLRIHELQAITLATLGQEARALKALQVVFSLAPDFKLTGNHPPRVTTVFYEARGWLAQHKPLEARQLPGVAKDGLITQLQVELINDPLELVKEVRFFLNVEGKVTQVEVPAREGLVVAPANLQRLSWWAVLLGEKEAVLKELSSSSSPRIEAAAPLPVPVAKVEKVEKEPVKVAPPPEEKNPEITEWVEPAQPMPGARVGAIALLGGGAAVAGLGVVFGVMANGTSAQVTGAQTDSNGRVTGITQKRALELDAQQRTEASLANVFIISGAALAAGGVTLLIFSFKDTQVALVPAAGGVSLAGTF